MKPLVTACAALLIFASAALQLKAAPVDPLIGQVSKANDIVQLATLQHDRKTMDAMLAPDFVLILSKGAIENRAAWLDDITDPSAHMETNQTSNISIHHYNNDAALVIGVLHLRYRQNNKLTDVRMRFLDVWVKQNNQWKWASSQVAHFP